MVKSSKKCVQYIQCSIYICAVGRQAREMLASLCLNESTEGAVTTSSGSEFHKGIVLGM